MNKNWSGRIWHLLWVGLIVYLVAADACEAASATINPAVITNDFVGKILITVTGLTAGKTLRFEKFSDANTNGVLNANETNILWRSFTVTDGQLPLLGGCTNVNVVGDMDGAANGVIHAELPYPGTDRTFDQFAIKYLYRISDPFGTFVLTNSFEVRQKVYLQGVSGKVTAAGTGAPLTNAVVVLIHQNGPGAFGAQANSNGNFTVYCTPDSYSLVSFYNGFISGASVTVNSNTIVSRNLTNTAASFTVSGKISDNSSGVGLPGIFVRGQGPSGAFAGSLTDTNGNYNFMVTAGQWQIHVGQTDVAQLAYIAPGNPITTNVSGNTPGLNFSLPKATALVYGRLMDGTGNPLNDISFFAQDSPNQQYESDGESFSPDGTYAVAVKAGDWCVGPDEDEPGLIGHAIPQHVCLTFTNGQAIRLDFVAPLCGTVQITTTDLPAGDTSFNYSVFMEAISCNSNFTWSVVSGTLPSGLDIDSHTGEIFGFPDTPGTNNFTVHVVDGGGHSTNRALQIVVTGTAQPLQVDTTFVPEGTNGMFYSFQFAASGGQPPYRWSVPNYSQSLPGNLSLSTNGLLSGIPTNSGTFYVRVTDSALGTNDAGPLTLFLVNPPFTITNTSLPGGTVGVTYNAQLGATGGQQPYNCWDLAFGSANLPPNLDLNCDGSITGIPTTAGTFNFLVQATDGDFTSATKALGITINANTAPLLSAPLWITNRFQARLTGVTGQNYTVQYSTTLTNWSQLLITNSGNTNSLLITDPAATNKQRSYRVLVGP